MKVKDHFEDALKESLPAKPGIRGAGRRHAVVLVLISNGLNGPDVIFQKRAAGITQPGEIGFPGGKVDPDLDRTQEDTALRETEEELGVPRSSVRVLGRLDSLLTRQGALIDVVVGMTDVILSDMRANPCEVERVFSLPLGWLIEQKPEHYGVVVKSHPTRVHPTTGMEEILLPVEELSLPERYGKPWGETIHPVLAYRTPEGVIWGITADILEDFLLKCWETDVGKQMLGNR